MESLVNREFIIITIWCKRQVSKNRAVLGDLFNHLRPQPSHRCKLTLPVHRPDVSSNGMVERIGQLFHITHLVELNSYYAKLVAWFSSFFSLLWSEYIYCWRSNISSSKRFTLNVKSSSLLRIQEERFNQFRMRRKCSGYRRDEFKFENFLLLTVSNKYSWERLISVSSSHQLQVKLRGKMAWPPVKENDNQFQSTIKVMRPLQ